MCLGAIFLVLTVLGAAAGIGWRQTVRLQASTARAEQGYSAGAELSRLAAAVEDLNAAVHAFVVDGTQPWLTRVDTAARMLTGRVERIDAIVGDLALPQTWREIQPLIGQRIEEARALVELRQAGSFVVAREALAGVGHGDRLEQIRGGLSAMELAQQKLAAERSGVLRDQADRTRFATVVGIAAGAALVLMALALLHREKTLRLRSEAVLEREVAGRVQREQERAAEGTLLQAFVAGLPEVAFAKDRDGRFLAATQACARELGVGSARELAGRSASEFLPSDVAARHEAEESSVLGGESLENKEEVTVTGDGRRCVRLVTKAPLRAADGTILGLIGLSRDVTASRSAEEALRQHNGDLERRVQERAAQLEAVNKEFESFSYSVSHDLRAPLRHIQGFVELLQRATDGQLAEKPRHFMKVISDASVEMGRLIDDLLAFSRVGRVEMLETRVHLDGLLRETLRVLQPPANGRTIDWKILPLPEVVGDVAMLRQVIVNVIDNAVKYTRGREPAEIEVGCAGESEGWATIYVRDNGTGFDMKYAHKLFGVFQRLHRADEFEGTGIGLATVRRVLARHGGRVWAEAEVGRGATFYFTLRKATPDRPAVTIQPAQA
jgi:PAS domain S-box-containing protein